MDTQTLIGSWISAGSEIPDHKVGTEVYHFAVPDIFLLEFSMGDDDSQVSSSRFTATAEGFRYGTRESMPHEVVAWIEGDAMIWRPVHGMETWFTRIDAETMPEWIRGRQILTKKLQNTVRRRKCE